MNASGDGCGPAGAAVELRGIAKRFPGVLALGGVDFGLRPGEVHGLLGENGAGKSTLMNILAGLYRPDSGEIRLAGEAIRLRSPREAIARGIGMVHQHFMLVPSLTVAENVILGLRRPRLLLHRAAAERQVADLGRRHGLEVDPRARVWQLSVGEQQRVEILKVLYRGARILLLDEPCAVLAPAEAEGLFRVLREMAGKGHAVVLISHKLEQVLRVADRLTVLRKGRVMAAGVPASAISRAELVERMMGRSLDPPARPARSGMPAGVVLETGRLCAQSDRGLPALRGVSLRVRAGEIYGLAGVAGNGQRELAEVLTGLRPASGGWVRVAGEDCTRASAAAMIRAGVAHVPEDRHQVGSVAGLDLVENLVLKSGSQGSRGWLIDWPALRRRAEEQVGRFQISVPSTGVAAGTLSGGNLQRLILARELSGTLTLLVAVQPTRGLDVAASQLTHSLLLEQRDRGTAILLISEDLDELLSLCDRVGVLFGGRLVGELGGERASIEEIGRLMTGVGGRAQ